MGFRRVAQGGVLSLGLAVSVACGPTINLQEALAVTDVLSGYYDNGLKDGWNHLVPSITFRLKNMSDTPISSVQLTLDYWFEGDDGPRDSALVRGIGSDDLAPGASTEPITVRFSSGFRLEAARAELFNQSRFTDATIKIFARRSGTITPLSEFKVERRLLPHVPSARRP